MGIFDSYLPEAGSVLDVGGGPGTHAAHLAARGYDVTLLDPVPRHVAAARRRAGATPPGFNTEHGDAQALPVADASVDVVLLLGPLYHLVDAAGRRQALSEAKRVLRPGGRLLVEVISRHAWLLDATSKEILGRPKVWDDFDHNVETGLSYDPNDLEDGGFWAYFHHPEELRSELELAGFAEISLVAVEGFAWLLGDLERRMTEPNPLLRAIRLIECEPSMLGCSAHVIGVATRA